jgi:hypothetical protein
MFHLNSKAEKHVSAEDPPPPPHPKKYKSTYVPQREFLNPPPTAWALC